LAVAIRGKALPLAQAPRPRLPDTADELTVLGSSYSQHLFLDETGEFGQAAGTGRASASFLRMEMVGQVLDSALGLSATNAYDLTTAQVCLRAFVIYLLLIFFVRIGKKRFLGQATAFDAVLVIMIGSIASRAVSGTAPFVATMAATLVFVVAHWLISLVAKDSPSISSLVKGHDTVLIRNGRVDLNALAKAHMSSDDLAEDLRQQGIADKTELKEARLERSGKLSVIKK
jgi:hypothetical protein